jgi:hypothetical protein
MTLKHIQSLVSLWSNSQWTTKQNKTASAFGLYKSYQIYSYHNLYLTITLYVSWNQRCIYDACKKYMLNRSKYSSIQNVRRFNLDQIVLWCIVPNSCCISSEMSKILFTKYFGPSRTNYKFVTPLSFHQNNNYSHIYWIKSLTNQVTKTDQPKPGPFSLTIQPRKKKALGTSLGGTLPLTSKIETLK